MRESSVAFLASRWPRSRELFGGLELDGLVVGRAVGRTRPFTLNPSYIAKRELAAYLATLADADPDLQRAVVTLRRRPRRTGKATVTITKQSTLLEVALTVGAALDRHGVKAVLTGGACASIHSAGEYTSLDLDFVVTNQTTQPTLDMALGDVGFNRSGDRYLHPDTQFWVEFPRGPLAVGGDYKIRPTTLRGKAGSANVLSATDSCRDRLAAFYHWNDRTESRVSGSHRSPPEGQFQRDPAVERARRPPRAIRGVPGSCTRPAVKGGPRLDHGGGGKVDHPAACWRVCMGLSGCAGAESGRARGRVRTKWRPGCSAPYSARGRR